MNWKWKCFSELQNLSENNFAPNEQTYNEHKILKFHLTLKSGYHLPKKLLFASVKAL